MAADLSALTADLVAETAWLDEVLGALSPAQWQLATPAPGWTIADQVSHLAYFDEATLLSIRDPDLFRLDAEALAGRGSDFPDQIAAEYRHLGPAELLRWFRAARRALLDGYANTDPAARLPWYGLDMGLASSITARLMETWAHGQDIADTLGIQRLATSRLRHVAHLGVRSLPYSYTVNGLPQPDVPIRVELTAPDGGQWAWGPEDAADRVTGTALDFCLVVTQRRHRTDTGLVITGQTAGQWIAIAQAFAGAAGQGPAAAHCEPDWSGCAAGRGASMTPAQGWPAQSRPAARRPIRIANSSGFYGDRPAAAREMVEGGPIDVLTGDYLAELTMLILWKAQQKDPATGYARTAVTQLEHVLGTCLDRGIKIVNNAGGLNPAGLAREFGALAERLGLHPQIAYVTGDDLLPRLHQLLSNGEALAHLDTGQPLSGAGGKPVTANAYLGGWGITAALDAGADIVVCPRVTDASLVTGPAAWWHGWRREDFDQLAGAVLAGHVIECGPQATGGNYSFLDEITDRRYPGFPIAEVAADGSSVITKHPDTGGLVSPGTVTAQLLYEIAGPRYANPDVVAHFDTVTVGQDGPDRVRLSGTRGSPPPPTAKVAINFLGGHRNTMTLVLTGLDIEAKAAWAEQELFGILGGREQFADVNVRLLRFDRPDAPTNEQATAHLRITVKDPDPRKVGRRFSNATMELALGGYAGFHTTTPPGPESAYGVYWPALVPAAAVPHAVVLPDGTTVSIAPTAPGDAAPEDPAPGDASPGDAARQADGRPPATGTAAAGTAAAGPAAAAPLGRICAARSGDKGGNANIGIWTRDPAAYPWLRDYLTVDRLRMLLPECAPLDVHRFELPNLSALNFVIIGLLGEGVAASTRPDPQAKGLGEYLRSRSVQIPAALLGRGGP